MNQIKKKKSDLHSGDICPYAEASRKHPIFSLNVTLRFRLTQSCIINVGGQLLAKKG